MNKLLNEIYKINKIMSGNPINEDLSQDYVKRIKDILLFNGMLTPSVEQNLNSIIKIIDDGDLKNDYNALRSDLNHTKFEKYKNNVIHGAQEIDLVNSGLEDVMRETFKEILKNMKNLKKVSLRTAAYAIALNKLKQYHKDMGVSNAH